MQILRLCHQKETGLPEASNHLLSGKGRDLKGWNRKGNHNLLMKWNDSTKSENVEGLPIESREYWLGFWKTERFLNYLISFLLIGTLTFQEVPVTSKYLSALSLFPNHLRNWISKFPNWKPLFSGSGWQKTFATLAENHWQGLKRPCTDVINDFHNKYKKEKRWGGGG